MVFVKCVSCNTWFPIEYTEGGEGKAYLCKPCAS
jgi:hypothetical protein